jgi:hypothetical protein
MKTPLVIVLVIVAVMLGFLTIYSQQKGTVAQTTQEQGAVASAPAANTQAAPVEDGKAAPAAEGK